MYGYVANDPVNWVDPEGTFGIPAVAALIGAFFWSSETDTPGAATSELWQVPAAGLGAGLAAQGGAAMCAAANSNRYVRIGEGKFPEPFSKRLSIGSQQGKKFEIGITPNGRIDVKFGSSRYNIRSGD